jgi:threonine synthase
MKKINKKKHYYLKCVRCGGRQDEKVSHTLCSKCGGSLDAIYDYSHFKSPHDFYPVRNFKKIVTLIEGGTPLYRASKLGKLVGLKQVYVKNEGVNPTGVFKDRGSAIEITKAVELGAKAVMVASSGNMAASLAAYCAKAGLPCYVVVPEKTPLGKLAQMLEYGAHVIKIKGEYSTCVQIVEKLARKHGCFLAGDYVYRREGQKSLAYEVCAQMAFQVPDVVVMPAGAGTNASAIWKGFKEYKLLGIIKHLPKMVLVQAKGAAPIYESFKKGAKTVTPLKKTSTICSAVAVADPNDGDLALQAVYDSGGCVLKATDDQALAAQKTLASLEAIFVEPSSALAVAVLPDLIKKKIARHADKVLVIATGNGLKDPLVSLKKFPNPPVFKADHKLVSRYLSRADL